MLKRVKNSGMAYALVFTMMLPAAGFAADATKQDAAKKQMQNNDQKNAVVQAPAKPQPTKEELFSKASIAKLSETYGHLIQKGLENPIIKLDFTAVLKGMQDGKAGKPAPMSEQEYEDTINLVQEYAYQDLANKNLQEATTFLKDNAKKTGVKEIETGKLQYLVLQEGKGDVVTEETVPTVNYSGKYLDGTVFGSSEQSGGPIAISLNSTIPGFRKGVLGMKKGEKRRLFIHPDVGYGMSGQLLPNALLIFEIEVTDVKPKPKDDNKAAKGQTPGQQLASAEPLFQDQFDEEDGDDEDEREEYQSEMEQQDSEDAAAPTKTYPAPSVAKKG